MDLNKFRVKKNRGWNIKFVEGDWLVYSPQEDIPMRCVGAYKTHDDAIFWAKNYADFLKQEEDFDRTREANLAATKFLERMNVEE